MIEQVLQICQDLKSVDSDNYEYDRALVDIIVVLTGVEHDTAAEALGLTYPQYKREEA